MLEKTLDMRVPLTFDLDDCDLIARIIDEEVTALMAVDPRDRCRPSPLAAPWNQP